jgi:hypothetical protein
MTLKSLIAAAAVCAGATVIAAPQQAGKDVTVTGCLVQGSTPEVFVLRNARMDPKNSTEAPKQYVFVSHLEDTPLKNYVNHLVTTTGTVQPRTDVRPMVTPTVTLTAAEVALPVLTAKTLASIADKCPLQ